MEKFVLLFFQCSALNCSKADWNRRNTDDKLKFFSVRERGCSRVLLLIMIVLSSVQCLYSGRLQGGV